MSEENVRIFKRGVGAYNRRDVDALIADAHPDIEWHPALIVKLGGAAAVYRGHDGVRELFREIEETLAEIRGEFSEVHDCGERVVATGRLYARGRASDVITESPLGYVADFEEGKIRCVRTYLDPDEALAAGGLLK